MNSKKRLQLFLFIVLLFGGNIFAQTEKRPNILFILADDQSPLDLKVYNTSSELNTPTLDKLAAEGMVFDGAYHHGSWSGAVCQPSRTMIMTGRSVWHIPGNGNPLNSDANMVPVDIVDNTMGAIFNRAGYATMRTCKSGNSYAAANNQFTLNVESVCREGDDANGSAWHAEQVLEYLETREATAEKATFLIYYGFSHPHDPRNGKEGLLEKYGAVNHTDENTLPALNDSQPALSNNYLPEHPFFHGHYNLRDEERAEGVWTNRDEATIRNEMGREFACSENIDDQIARVLEKLEAMGELENTYIIYTADHGIAIGKHGLQGKQNLYDHTWKVPFIVNGPGVKAGRAEGNIYLYDILGTLCDLADITPPESVESVSFKPVLEGTQEVVRDVMSGVYCGGTKPGMRCVKKGDWKLIKYDVDDGSVQETQLFNIKDNPEELLVEHHDEAVIALTGNTPKSTQVNLADDAAYADTLALMEALLLQEMEASDDVYRLWDQPEKEVESPFEGYTYTQVNFSDAVATADNVYNDKALYSALSAIDTEDESQVSDLSTRWATNAPDDGQIPATGWILDVTFPTAVDFTHAIIYDYANRVSDFTISYLDGDKYVEVFTGDVDTEDLTSNIFRKVVELEERVTAEHVRYHIHNVVDPTKGPSTWGFELYDVNSTPIELSSSVTTMTSIMPTVVDVEFTIVSEELLTKVEVYALSGKCVFQSHSVDNTSYNISTLEQGSYIVALSNAEGVFFTQNILKC